MFSANYCICKPLINYKFSKTNTYKNNNNNSNKNKVFNSYQLRQHS